MQRYAFYYNNTKFYNVNRVCLLILSKLHVVCSWHNESKSVFFRLFEKNPPCF